MPYAALQLAYDAGLLGRGVYEAPVALFIGALDAVPPRLS